MADKKVLVTGSDGFIGSHLVEELQDARSNYWLNAIQLNSSSEKITFIENMNDEGIMCRPIWKLIHTLPMFSDCPKGNLENSIRAEEITVNITSTSRLGG